MIAALAERLGVAAPEANNLVEEVAVDAQLALIDAIWGTGDAASQESSSEEEVVPPLLS